MYAAGAGPMFLNKKRMSSVWTRQHVWLRSSCGTMHWHVHQRRNGFWSQRSHWSCYTTESRKCREPRMRLEMRRSTQSRQDWDLNSWNLIVNRETSKGIDWVAHEARSWLRPSGEISSDGAVFAWFNQQPKLSKCLSNALREHHEELTAIDYSAEKLGNCLFLKEIFSLRWFLHWLPGSERHAQCSLAKMMSSC